MQEAPDGTYTLDLDCHDERLFAQILVRLAFVEPGENWEDATYKNIAGKELCPILLCVTMFDRMFKCCMCDSVCNNIDYDATIVM